MSRIVPEVLETDAVLEGIGGSFSHRLTRIKHGFRAACVSLSPTSLLNYTRAAKLVSKPKSKQRIGNRKKSQQGESMVVRKQRIQRNSQSHRTAKVISTQQVALLIDREPIGFNLRCCGHTGSRTRVPPCEGSEEHEREYSSQSVYALRELTAALCQPS